MFIDCGKSLFLISIAIIIWGAKKKKLILTLFRTGPSCQEVVAPTAEVLVTWMGLGQLSTPQLQLYIPHSLSVVL